jgi:hypothetical protein
VLTNHHSLCLRIIKVEKGKVGEKVYEGVVNKRLDFSHDNHLTKQKIFSMLDYRASNECSLLLLVNSLIQISVMVMTMLCNSYNHSMIPAVLPCRIHMIHTEQNIYLQTATDSLHIFKARETRQAICL